MATATTKKKVAKKSAAKKKVEKERTVKKSVVGSKSVKKSQRSKSKSLKKDESIFNLGAVLAINDVKKLYADLGNLLGSSNNIILDASEVKMVDTAVFQLLLAFIKKTQSQNTSVVWLKPSKEFLSRAEILDLTDALGLSEV